MRKKEPLGSPWRTKEESSLFLQFVLALVGLFERPLAAARVEPAQFRELLRTRLVLDLRPADASGNAYGIVGTVLTILLGWLGGMGTGLIGLLSGNAELWVVVSQSALFLLLLFALLQSLVAMLMDPTDVRVLGRHPVQDRTLFAVRLAQLFAYLFVLGASFLAGNVLLAVWRLPVAGVLLVYPLLTLLGVCTALGMVALVVAAVLKLAGPERFQRVSLWIQVGAAAALAGGLQVLPRMLPRDFWRQLWESPSAWKTLWPPVAYGKTFEFVLGHGEFPPLALGVTLLVPVLALAVTLALASRHFIAGVQGALEGSGKPRPRWPGGLLSRLARGLVRGREQLAGLEFARALSLREGHVLRGALPQFFSMQAMTFGVCLGPRNGMGSGFLACMSAGMLAFVVPTVLELCQGTATPGARWLFLAAPLEDEAEVMRGGLKGLLLVWYGVGMAVLGLAMIAILGPAELAAIVLALELSIVMTLFYARLYGLGIPFRREIRQANMANVGLVMTMFFGLGVLGGIHWLLTRHPWSAGGGIALTAGLIALQWRGLDRMAVGRGCELAAGAKLEKG